jgi:indole-3-glycerol phosphate synthase
MISSLMNYKSISRNMSDVLAKICADKWQHIRNCKSKSSEGELLARAQEQEAPRGFRQRLATVAQEKGRAIIAEVKKASPSKGLIRADFNHLAIAAQYAEHGAACISVLTDEPYFQGQDRYLQEIRQHVDLPLLRKDFMLDPYQIIESRALGADSILLIVAALDVGQMQELEAAALDLGMDVLIEVHDERELDIALSELSSPLLGINNRNLKTLEFSLDISRQLAPRLPAGYHCVCESGIYSREDIAAMLEISVSSFLIGESLMRQENVGEALAGLVG